MKWFTSMDLEGGGDDLFDRVAEVVMRSEARPALKRFVHRYDCATPEQYGLWVATIRSLQHVSAPKAEPGVPKEERTTPIPFVWFCTDCTPEYQAKMIEEKRCRHPEIKFGRGEDGFIEGYLPDENRKALYYQNRKNRADHSG